MLLSAGTVIVCGASDMKVQCSDLPVVYSRQYNITLYGIQKLHPFDSEKYGRIAKKLKKDFGAEAPCFYEPSLPSQQDLLLVHTPHYLSSLRRSSTIAAVTEMFFIRYIPAAVLRKKILKPMLYATGGTIRGIELALKHGWAINLSGGYHHAKANEGGGFCAYSDIAIAIKKLWQKYSDKRVLIVDVDAHQGNGYASIFYNEPRVIILDAYNGLIYPKDFIASSRIDYAILLDYTDTELYYLQHLQKNLSLAIVETNPDLILYNAGTDVYIHDNLGQLRISEKGIIQRDEIVFRLALNDNVPICMVLSGGYHRHSAEIAAASIENLVWGKLELKDKLSR